MTPSPSIVSTGFEVFGKVQGVWFRKYCVENGNKLRVVGWVRNTDRGTVEGIVQGEADAVEVL
ncbi:acylphosphatase [Spizellomyces sp. 'palustris']|nr:acylphosphatase [Spizellomyces sp. 'palustris']